MKQHTSTIIKSFILILTFLSVSFTTQAKDSQSAIRADLDTEVGQIPLPYAIGDTGPAGGFVFYVEEDGLHGLEAAPTDQSTGIRWHNGDGTNTDAHRDGVKAGEINTRLIIANQGSDSNSYAAGLCANIVISHQGVDYGDWYLPSKYELALMYDNIGHGATNVGVFALDTYWSSTEGNKHYAWLQLFNYGTQSLGFKNLTHRVRAVRAF